MGIYLPITLVNERPIEPQPSPYNQCGMCQYVGVDVQLGSDCPACNARLNSCLGWPEPALQELWHDEVFCWNHEKPELATVVAAMYFEASVFNLLYQATCWLDPDLNWIGAAFEEVRDKGNRIWKYLDSLDTLNKTNAALEKVFGASGKSMLDTVLGTEAAPFWENYMHCKRWRNHIAHRGRRIYYETVPDDQQKDDAFVKERTLWASLSFVPTCWVVFSKLWNEYLHKPTLARRKAGG